MKQYYYIRGKNGEPITPVGTIFGPFSRPVTSSTDDFILCDGKKINPTIYPELYALYIKQGSGKCVPDLRKYKYQGRQ